MQAEGSLNHAEVSMIDSREWEFKGMSFRCFEEGYKAEETIVC